MIMNETVQNLISGTAVVLDLVVFIFAVVFVMRSKTPDSRLILTGTGLQLLLRVFYVVLPLIMNNFPTFLDSEAIRDYYRYANMLSLVARLLFALGFVMLVNRLTTKV